MKNSNKSFEVSFFANVVKCNKTIGYMHDYLPTPTVLVYYRVPSGEMPGTLGCIVLFCKSECDSKNETKKKN